MLLPTAFTTRPPDHAGRRPGWGRRLRTTAVALTAGLAIVAAGAGPAHAATTSLSPQVSTAGVLRLAGNAPTTCVIRTYDGHYLTAVGGGGRTTDVLHTDATRAGSWEKFTLVDPGDGSSPLHYGFRTYRGYYLTAVGSGGRVTDVMHSNATRILAWEKLTLESLGYGSYSIRTADGHYLSAVGGGGRITDTIHSTATRVGSWEKFRLTCGL